MNLSKKLTNGDNKKSLADTLPVSVTHFSPSMNGFGLEKETIFTEENGINGHDNGISETKPKNTNPFLSNSPESENDNYRSQMRKENNNYENVRLFAESEASPANPFTSGKFNTIGRSNPFSSVKGNNTNRNNPFLDTSGSTCDTTDSTIKPNSPDASIDPTPILQPEYRNMLDSFSKPSINGKQDPTQQVTRSYSSAGGRKGSEFSNGTNGTINGHVSSKAENSNLPRPARNSSLVNKTQTSSVNGNHNKSSSRLPL